MRQFPSYSGLATVILDYTNELSLLGYALFSPVALSGGMLVFTATRYHLSQRGKPVTGIAPSVGYLKAA
jgi:hypothetical protein